MSLYNIVPTHIRFNLNMLYSQARNSSREQALRRGKPKEQKSKIFLRARNFWIFGFPRVFRFFNRNPKNHMVFLDSRWKTKKHKGFFCFLVRSLVKNQKNPVFFDFCWKTKKHNFFWISVRKPKKTRKTKKSKSFRPLRKVLDVWFVVPSAETKKNPKPF